MSLAILCPGQGGQYPAMFELTAGVASAEAVLDKAREVLPRAPLELLANGTDIFRNRIAQPLVCAAILARWEAVKSALPEPRMVLGYSVGELAAHAIAGSFDTATCLRLANRRAELMDEESPDETGLVGVLGLNQSQVEALCTAHGLTIAIVNGAGHFVLGGSTAGLNAVELEAQAVGAHTSRINVSVPAHTPWLAAAGENFAEELMHSDLSRPKILVLSAIDGRVVRTAGAAAETLAAQISQTLYWQQCFEQAVEMGARVFLELGPGNALAKIARELSPRCNVYSLDEFRTLAGAVTWIGRALESESTPFSEY